MIISYTAAWITTLIISILGLLYFIAMYFVKVTICVYFKVFAHIHFVRF